MAHAKRFWLAAASIAVALWLACPLIGGPPDYGPEREAMVAQLRGLGIQSDRVLAAVREVPRHLFVRESDRDRAYQDVKLPAGGGRSCCRPYVVALSAQVLDLEPASEVLQVGAGCGYETAILAKLSPNVHVIDFRQEVIDAARPLLQSTGHTSIAWTAGAACKGWEEHAPYDAILVTCASQTISENLVKQLREGGRILIPVGRGPAQTLTCVRKTAGKIRSEKVMKLRAEPMYCERSSS